MDSPAASLAGVVERLLRARSRIRGMLVADAAAVAAVAGISVFFILELVRRLLPDVWEQVLGGQDLAAAVVLGLGAGILVLGAGVVAAYVRTPQIERLAQQSDHLFGLEERVSTALEASRDTTGAPQSVLVAALIRDAVERTPAIDAAKLGRFRLPRAALALPIAAIAAVVVVTTVPVSALPQPEIADASRDVALSEGERAAVAEDIRRVADLVEDQATSQRDPYMQAVANTLRTLGEQVATSPETTRGDVLDELGALMEYAMAAGSEYRGSDSERIPALIDALAKAVATPRDVQMPVEGESPAGLPGGEAGTESAEGEPQTAAETAAADDLNSMLEDLEQANSPAGSADDAARPKVGVDYFRRQPPTGLQPGQPGDSTEGAQLIGPAADANAGDSQLAGEGSNALGDAVAPTQVDITTAIDLVLAADDRGEGRRIKFEATPEVNLTPITEESLGTNAERWEATAVGEVNRYSIDFDDREAVSRYLRALIGQFEE